MVVAYIKRYGTEFYEPSHVGAYNKMINEDTTTIVCARMGVAHKPKRSDCGTYKAARRETDQFILAVIEDT